MLGIPINSIFLVKNYDNVTKIDEKMDAPILCALRQIIAFGEKFLNNVKWNIHLAYSLLGWWGMLDLIPANSCSWNETCKILIFLDHISMSEGQISYKQDI